MAEVIPQITVDSSKVKNTWVQNEVVTNDVYNAINKAVIDLKNNNNLLDTNAILFREQYNSSSKDLNNAIHQGIYSFTSSAVNSPSGVDGGNLLVTNTSKTEQGSSIITQVAFCHNGAVYARTKNTSENFTAWNKLAYINDTIAKAIADKNGNDITTGYMARANGYISGTKDLNTFYKEGSWAYGSDYANSPNGGWGKVLVLNNFTGVNDEGTWIYQLAFPTTGSVNFYFRRNIINSGWTTWQEVATMSAVKDYAPSKTGSGASGTWNITANKAIQDSQGQQINTTYVKNITANNATLTITKGNGTTSTTTVNNVSHATNADNSIKATQDKNGNDITTNYIARINGNTTIGDLNKLYTEGSYGYDNTCLNSPNGEWGKVLVLNNFTGVNDEGTWIYQLAFPTTGSVNFYFRRNIINSGWTTWRAVAFTESPAFSGTPTAPTPSTSDNSTRVATTAFVKSLFTASKATNGWHKEASTGLIWQWGQEANYHDVMDDKYGSSGSLNFPISFPNKCLAVMPYLIGSKNSCCVSVSSFTNAKITVNWDEWASDTQSIKFGYIAVGY